MTRELTGWFESQGASLEVTWHAGGHEIAEAELASLLRFLTA